MTYTHIVVFPVISSYLLSTSLIFHRLFFCLLSLSHSFLLPYPYLSSLLVPVIYAYVHCCISQSCLIVPALDIPHLSFVGSYVQSLYAPRSSFPIYAHPHSSLLTHAHHCTPIMSSYLPVTCLIFHPPFLCLLCRPFLILARPRSSLLTYTHIDALPVRSSYILSTSSSFTVHSPA